MDKSKMANILPRMAAAIIDNFIVGLVGGVLGGVLSFLVIAVSGGSPEGGLLAQALYYLVFLVITFGYFTYFLSKDGTTPGLKYLGLRIVKEDGSILTTGQALLRTFVFSLLWLINLILILASEKRQGVHDMAAGTVCEKVDEQESRAKWVVGIWCGCGCLMFIAYILFFAALFSAVSSGSVAPSDFGM